MLLNHKLHTVLPFLAFFSVFTVGVNVDWPAWCFDDDDVLDNLHLGEEGFLESINRSLASRDIPEISEQEDGHYSHV